MVQGSEKSTSANAFLNNKQSACCWDNSNKKSGFEAMQQQRKKDMEKEEERKKYGAWGSTFKSKDNFASMHHC